MRVHLNRRQCLALGAAAMAGPVRGAAARFRDPLDTPADALILPAAAPLMAMATAGARLVGVGLRGAVITSDDAGTSWQQVIAPVQSDLTGVHFPSAKSGWIVGHDGVILRSADGGRTWAKQLDGRKAATLFNADYAARVTAGEVARADMDQLALNYQSGPSLPYLDVWFEDDQRGWAVGSFGMVAATQDGGNTWVPALHRVDNPNYLNLFSVRGIGSDLYITAERGRLFKFNRSDNKFAGIGTGYAGSFFGVTGQGPALLAYGLRGTLFRSPDAGQTWSRVPLPVTANLTAATYLGESTVVVGNTTGALLGSGDSGVSFKPLPTAATPGLTGLLALDHGRLLAYGLRGVKVLTSLTIQS